MNKVNQSQSCTDTHSHVDLDFHNHPKYLEVVGIQYCLKTKFTLMYMDQKEHDILEDAKHDF